MSPDSKEMARLVKAGILAAGLRSDKSCLVCRNWQKACVHCEPPRKGKEAAACAAAGVVADEWAVRAERTLQWLRSA